MPQPSTSSSNDSVLIIDNDEESRSAALVEMSFLECDLYLAENRDDGLKILRNNKVDLVVYGMKIGDENSADFISHIKDNFPNTHRILLNSADEEAAAASAIARGYATANMVKPWEEDRLSTNVEHILKIRKTLKQAKLLESLNEIDRLPSLPSLYQDFTEAVMNEKPIKEIAGIIESDVSLSARLLQIANSAFYGSSGIYSVDQAVMRLGINTVKDMVLTFSFVNEMNWSPLQQNELQKIFSHSSLVNKHLKTVYRMKHKSPLSLDMACVGITHDIGKIIILQYFPDRYHAILDYQKENPKSTFYESEEALGFEWYKHEEVGAYFLNMWNLPDPVVEATLFHHSPNEAGEKSKDVIKALAYVNELTARLEMQGEDDEPDCMRIMEGYLSDEDHQTIVMDIRSAITEQTAC